MLGAAASYHVVVFYHHPCLDGTAAAWVAYKRFRKQALYIGVGHHSYKTIENTLASSVPIKTKVIFLDYAPPVEIVRNLLQRGFKVEIYDHHLSAYEALRSVRCDALAFIFDEKKSGSRLVWDALLPDEKRPLIIDMIESIDLDSKTAFSSLDQYFTIAAFLDRINLENFPAVCAHIDAICEWNLADFEREGRVHRAYFQILIDKAIPNLNYIVIKDVYAQNIPFIETDLYTHSRELVPHILKRENAQVVAIWFKDGEDSFRINLQSPESNLAKIIANHVKAVLGCQGGGHAHSTVLRMDIDRFTIFLREYLVFFEQSNLDY